MKLYRFFTNEEGVWSAGKRLLPQNLVEEANQNRSWLNKPDLPDGNYRFWLTELGKDKYEKTLFKTHQKYLPDIKIDEIEKESLDQIAYEDEFQIVELVT